MYILLNGESEMLHFSPIFFFFSFLFFKYFITGGLSPLNIFTVWRLTFIQGVFFAWTPSQVFLS